MHHLISPRQPEHHRATRDDQGRSKHQRADAQHQVSHHTVVSSDRPTALRFRDLCSLHRRLDTFPARPGDVRRAWSKGPLSVCAALALTAAMAAYATAKSKAKITSS